MNTSSIQTKIQPKVLITNDDGPPGPDSPFIKPFVDLLKEKFRWEVGVCIPDSQKSWISKAFHINEQVHVSYLHSDQTISKQKKSIDDWVLLSGTPATCTNIGLHHMFPETDFDLVIAGPNFGRNSGATFTLASGTIGAALDAALSKKRAIALSFAFYDREITSEQITNTCSIAANIINYLWQYPWHPSISIYNVNVPLTNNDSVPIHITKIYNNSYGSLFKQVIPPKDSSNPNHEAALELAVRSSLETEHGDCFRFSPSPAIIDTVDLPEGTDAWAVHNRFVSITPLRASYAVVEGIDLKLDTMKSVL